MFLSPLFSGSSGNATLVDIGGARILVDAGKPCKTVLAALEAVSVPPESIDAILITHEHSDHVSGVGPIARRFGIPVYANAPTWEGMQQAVGELPPRCVRVFESGRDFYIGAVNILPFRTPHDARESVGFTFSAGGRRLAVMTDIGHADARLLSCVEGADLLLIESNHDAELVKSCGYPYVTKRRILSDSGHLSNENCGRALAKLYLSGVHNAILGHLSRDNNFESLALETVRAELRAEDIPDDAFALCVAHRDRVTGKFTIGE